MKFPLLTLLALAMSATCAIAQDMDPRAIDRLRQADMNKDGQTTRTEFTTFRTNNFARIDRNRDGYLTPKDAPPFGARAIGFDINQLMRDFDKNGDGKVSRQELAAGPTPVFDHVDSNKDNTVSDAEVRAAAAAARRNT
jgi:Ca2+-binding EF-hand superfamily protein